MSFILIVGNIGSGKTLLMTKFLLEDYQDGQSIMTNYELTFDHTFMTEDDFKNYENWEYADISIGFDEIHIYMDSRLPTKHINRIMGYFFTQSRKRDVNIYGTTQFAKQLDLRARNVADYIISCEAFEVEPDKDNKKYNTGFEKGSMRCKKCYHYLKHQGHMPVCDKLSKQLTIKSMSCEHFILPDVYIKWEKYDTYNNVICEQGILYANEYYAHYDTYKVIKPINDEKE